MNATMTQLTVVAKQDELTRCRARHQTLSEKRKHYELQYMELGKKMSLCRGATEGQQKWLRRKQEELDRLKGEINFFQARIAQEETEQVEIERAIAGYEAALTLDPIAPVTVEFKRPALVGIDRKPPQKHPRRYVAKGERVKVKAQKAKKSPKRDKGKKPHRGGKRIIKAA